MLAITFEVPSILTVLETLRKCSGGGSDPSDVGRERVEKKRGEGSGTTGPSSARPQGLSSMLPWTIGSAEGSAVIASVAGRSSGSTSERQRGAPQITGANTNSSDTRAHHSKRASYKCTSIH